MVQNTFNKDLKQNERIVIYEIFQGFCLYNMKQSYKSNQIFGSACLSMLIQNTDLFKENKYLKVIYENIIYHIDKQYFNGKKELLESILGLTIICESSFKPFAEKSITKIRRFLTDEDWFKRKLVLDIICKLYFHCKNELVSLRSSLIDQISSLKSDKEIKVVRESCFSALKILREKNIDKEVKVNENNSFKNTSFLSEDQEKYYDFLDFKERSKSTYLDHIKNSYKVCMSSEGIENMKTKKVGYNQFNKKQLKSRIIKNVRSESTLKPLNNKSNEFFKSNKSQKLVITNRDNSLKKRIISIFKGPKNKEFFENIPNGVEILTRNEETEYQKTKEKEVEVNNQSEKLKKEKKKVQSSESSIVEYNFQNKENNSSPFSINSEPIPKEENGYSNNPTTVNEIIKQLKFISEKQIILMDSLQNLQEFTKDQVRLLNQRIEKIESFIGENINPNTKKIVTSSYYKNNTLRDSYSKDIYSKSLDSREFKHLKENTLINESMKSIQNLINTNPVDALNNSLKGDSINIIKFIEKIEVENIVKIPEEKFENLLDNLVFLLEKGEFIIIITSWFKNILSDLKIILKQRTYESIKDSYMLLKENKKKYKYSIDFQQEINEIIELIERRKSEDLEKA